MLIGRWALCLLVVTLMAGCVSVPVRMGAVPGKEYTVIGKSEGSATGFVILYLIPFMQNSRFERAYQSAVQKGGGDDIINPEITEWWYWLYFAHGFTTTVKGDVIKYEQIEKATEKSIMTLPLEDQNDIPGQLEKLKKMKALGVLTEEEYQAKRKLLVDRL